MHIEVIRLDIGSIKPVWLKERAELDIIVPPEARITKPITILNLHGSLDGSSYEALIAKAQQQIEGGAERMIIDLQNVTFLSSAGIVGIYSVGALLETKWLKDARHHNDKGAWILQLREVRKQYPTIRGAVAILAGYWTEGVGVLLMSEGGIKMVVVATDEEIYSTLQGPLDEYLGEDSFVLDAPTMRQSYPRPWDLANFLIELEEAGRLEELAASWLGFVRGEAADGSPLSGAELVKVAIDELLEPLPEEPRITSFEVALQVDSGNTIYQEFEDVEDVVEFIRTHFQNPQTILERITPKKSPRQQRFADFE